MDVKALIFDSTEEFKHLESTPVAFFCAEYAFDEDTSMYAGGLGVLAGDFILESADEKLPFVAIGLWYGGPKDASRAKEFSILEKDGIPVIIEVPCEEGLIKARVWVRKFGTSVYMMLLDTNISENSTENQGVTLHLYDLNFQVRVKQTMVLGIGGVRLLSSVGITPSVYHLNEGHTAFGALELVLEQLKNSENVAKAVELAKEKIVATKHTIFSIAGPAMHDDELDFFIGKYCRDVGISVGDIFRLGARKDIEHVFSTTQFLLNCAKRQNGVSVLHTVFEKKTHPSSMLFPITNGVYQKRWQAKDFEGDNKELSDEKIWQTKFELRKKLVDFVNTTTGSSLSYDLCTIVWARRFASYKRPNLIFSDISRLKKFFTGTEPIQFIISGKAHPSDTEAIKVVEQIKLLSKDSSWNGRIAYLPDYSINLADKLVKGADVWLNTPDRGFEACGTSGMKAGLNCALEASVSDGWIDEVDWSGVGFVLPEVDTANATYDIIEKDIIPLFNKRNSKHLPIEWINRMRKTKDIVESGFTAKRMLRDYLKKSYMVI